MSITCDIYMSRSCDNYYSNQLIVLSQFYNSIIIFHKYLIEFRNFDFVLSIDQLILMF